MQYVGNLEIKNFLSKKFRRPWSKKLTYLAFIRCFFCMLKHMEKELMYSTERFFSACTVLPLAKDRIFLADVGDLVCKIQMVMVDML